MQAQLINQRYSAYLIKHNLYNNIASNDLTMNATLTDIKSKLAMIQSSITTLTLAVSNIQFQMERLAREVNNKTNNDEDKDTDSKSDQFIVVGDASITNDDADMDSGYEDSDGY
jgi:hypothetical protein